MAIKDFGFSARTRNSLRNDWDEGLLRSELFSIEQLKRHAVTLAGQHNIDPHPGPDRLLPRLADNARVLTVGSCRDLLMVHQSVYRVSMTWRWS